MQNLYELALERAAKDTMKRVTPTTYSMDKMDEYVIKQLLEPRGLKINNDVGKVKIFSSKLPKHYIINDGATILFWEDGTKTIVRRCEDDTYDKRLGFLTAYFQKNSGLSKNKANKFLASLKEETPKCVEKNEIIKVEEKDSKKSNDIYELLKKLLSPKEEQVKE